MQSYQSVVPLKGQKDFKKDFKGLLKSIFSGNIVKDIKLENTYKATIKILGNSMYVWLN